MSLAARASSSWLQRVPPPIAELGLAVENFVRHRSLLWQLVGNDIRGRYIGSILGLFWNVVHPLIQIGIYTLVFSKVMGSRLPQHASAFGFSMYLCAGLLPWVIFAEVINRSTGVFWDNANLVKKIAFPKVLLHTYITAAGAVNLMIVVTIFLVFLWVAGEGPSPVSALVWACLMMLQLLLAMGIGLFTSVLNVFFRDVAQLTAVTLQVWFWLTPIVYVVDVLPTGSRRWLSYNVLYRFTTLHQGLVLNSQLPSVRDVMILAVISLTVLFLGLTCFRTARRRIPDEL